MEGRAAGDHEQRSGDSAPRRLHLPAPAAVCVVNTYALLGPGDPGEESLEGEDGDLR